MDALGDSFGDIGYRANLAGESDFAEDESVFSKWTVLDGGEDGGHDGQVAGGLVDLDAADNVDVDVEVVGADREFLLQYGEEESEPVPVQALGEALGYGVGGGVGECLYLQIDVSRALDAGGHDGAGDVDGSPG